VAAPLDSSVTSGAFGREAFDRVFDARGHARFVFVAEPHAVAAIEKAAVMRDVTQAVTRTVDHIGIRFVVASASALTATATATATYATFTTFTTAAIAAIARPNTGPRPAVNRGRIGGAPTHTKSQDQEPLHPRSVLHSQHQRQRQRQCQRQCQCERPGLDPKTP
jgi:hypothetical protein